MPSNILLNRLSMKKFLLTALAIFLLNQLSYAQFTALGDTTAIGLGTTSTSWVFKFQYQNHLIAHYGLGWYSDPDFVGAPTGYLGGYAGLKFFTTGQLRVSILANGDTQIGGNLSLGTTDAKGYKLAVNGNAIANSVTVKMYPWADFVFQKEYQLPSLADVKLYIYKNHHLPDIPSEKEISRDGLNLGQMNKLLTQKVEELTLYLIEQNRQIELLQQKDKLYQEQEERIKNLEKQMNDLSKK